MKTAALLAAALLLTVAACDDKKDETKTAASASAAMTASAPPPAASPSMIASAAPPAESASAAAPASSTSMVTGDAKDLMVTIRDPKKETEKTVKVAAGGTLTLFLPDYPGTVWVVDKPDATLGKPKEEVIPGFAPKTNGHQFKWTGVKAGKAKVTLGNKPAADKAAKPTEFFALTVDAS